jgi:hypothetical protein
MGAVVDIHHLCEDEPDTDPDDEEYEGYTGNAGPTVE